MKKTTKEDFRLFKKAFREYQVLFGLTGWHITFEHVDIQDVFANITHDLSSYQATVRLSKLEKSGNVRWDAKHECIHLVLARIDCEARTRFTNVDTLIEANEETVNRLMEVIP